MKRFGFSVNSMKLAFKTYILPIIEYACPVWGPSVQLSAGMCQDIEAIQIQACKIMLGQAFTTYDNALKVLGLESLFNRRQRLICQFGHFLLRSSKHRTILPLLAPVTSRTRRQYKLNPVTCRPATSIPSSPFLQTWSTNPKKSNMVLFIFCCRIFYLNLSYS